MHARQQKIQRRQGETTALSWSRGVGVGTLDAARFYVAGVKVPMNCIAARKSGNLRIVHELKEPR
jgi:hypothetical protein